MTTIIAAFFLVLWLNPILIYGANIEIPAVFHDGNKDTNDIIIKLTEGGTTDDIEHILNKHRRFKLGRQFDLRGETYFVLFLDKNNKPKADVNGTIKPLSEDDEHLLSMKHDRKVDTMLIDYKYQVEPRAVSRTDDPELKHAWYTTKQPDVKVSMNIDKAWKKGYSGKNVNIAVIDTQVQLDHEDLGNIDVENSMTTFENQTNQEMENDNVITGTALAGIIAATKNGFCTTGVAYNAIVQATGIIPPPEGDLWPPPPLMETYQNGNGNGNGNDEAISVADAVFALNRNLQTVDIYTAKLGSPTNKDFGSEADFISIETTLATGVSNGRNGKGSIYVFGAGDEGPKANAAVDLYGISMYSICISSVEYASVAEYGEIGSNIMAVGYGGSHRHKLINYVYPDNKCSNTSGEDGIYGTSFAAAQVAGIIALALEANPDLTWRDVQHLIVRSSRRFHFKDRYYPEYKWRRNGFGFYFHPKMGFGLVDALKMVNMAKRWKPVSNMTSCFFESPLLDMTTENGNYLISNVRVRRIDCSIQFIENVIVFPELAYSKLRGYIEIDLISPKGTASPLLTERPDDNAETTAPGELFFAFRSVHFWGENTIGNWKLRIRSLSKYVKVGSLLWGVEFYGTKKKVLNNG